MKFNHNFGKAVLAIALLTNISFSPLASAQTSLEASIQQSLSEKQQAIDQRNQEITDLQSQSQKIMEEGGIKRDVLIFGGLAGITVGYMGTLVVAKTGPTRLQQILAAYLEKTPPEVKVLSSGQLIRSAAPWIVLMAAGFGSAIYGSVLTTEVNDKVRPLAKQVVELSEMNNRDAVAIATLKKILDKQK